MGLRVNTNIAAWTAMRHLSAVNAATDRSFARLASGLRIATAADDPSGLGLSERMRAEIRSTRVAQRNVQDGISLVQTAEGALAEVGNMLARMRELAIQGASGTLDNFDRIALNFEFQQLNTEIERIAETTHFNGIDLLMGGGRITLQVGTDAGDTLGVFTANTTPVGLRIAGLSVSTQNASTDAVDDLDLAIDRVSLVRGYYGGTQNVLEGRLNTLATARENLSAAESRIRDADLAEETAELTRNRILQQVAVAVLAQAQVQPRLALDLLVPQGA